MKRAVYLCYRDPIPEGDGGNHRAYQVQEDLLSLYGDDCLVLSTSHLKNALKYQRGSLLTRGWWRIRKSVLRREKSFRENPYRLFVKTQYTTHQYTGDFKRLAYYKRILEQEKPAVVVVDSTGFADFIELNKRYGIPTIMCPQNFDALDRSMPTMKSWFLPATMLDFSNELRVLRDCDYRLLISKTEVFFANGMNIPSVYYPYLPVGEVRSTLLRLRARRIAAQKEKGLFLLLGSATHAPAKEGMLWFLQQLETQGIPDNVKFIFAGKGTDNLAPDSKWGDKIQFLGRIEQEVLDDLLVKVNGMLIPHWRGFGALTRIAETACAGVPLVLAQHPALAVDLPPYTIVAEKTWSSWIEAIRQVMEGTSFDPANYDVWYQNQPATLIDLCKQIADVKN